MTIEAVCLLCSDEVPMISNRPMDAFYEDGKGVNWRDLEKAEYSHLRSLAIAHLSQYHFEIKNIVKTAMSHMRVSEWTKPM